MRFVKETLDTSKIDDPVFAISRKAQADKDPQTINATIGSLYDEDGKIVALSSYYDVFDKIDDRLKAKYAEGADGNSSYKKAVRTHVLKDHIKLPVDVLATAGGSGAVSLVLKDFLKEGDTVLLPEIAWASYKTMAYEYGLDTVLYKIDDVDDILDKAHKIAKTQDKIVLVINSPCHNPTGLSLTDNDWQRIIDDLNRIESPVIILNDIAYIDYAHDPIKARSYLDVFNTIGQNILVAVAFSISKTMTAYGSRLGALIMIHQDEEILSEVHNALARSCRNIWSNVNNGAMIAFSEVIENDKAFLKEKAGYINLLKERADIFLKEADEAGLDHYRYDEGFFITLKCKDNTDRDDLHAKLMDGHIYTVKVNKGIRIAICSIPKAQLYGLAGRIKAISDRR